jgi:hypothetical protein
MVGVFQRCERQDRSLCETVSNIHVKPFQTKRRDAEPSLVSQTHEIPALFGDRMLRSTEFARGVVRLTESFVSLAPTHLATETPPTEFGLHWQGMHQTDSDHGYSVACGVLSEAGLWLLDATRRKSLAREVNARVSPAIWRLLEARIDPDPMDDDAVAMSDTLLVAVWAELFAEPLTDIWLAAMAMHAHHVERNDFAFGYLIAQIDHRRATESDFLRGKKSVDSGKLGGAARKSATAARTRKTIAEMRNLVGRGMSVRRAAELVAKRGVGASTEANKKLWNRHLNKVGT